MSAPRRSPLILLLAAVAAAAALVVAALLGWAAIRSWVPQPAPPNVVVVVASAPGFPADDLETLVASPLEHQLAGAPSMRALRTISTEGHVLALCSFDAHQDRLLAADTVRSRVRVGGLPSDVRVTVAPHAGAESVLVRYEVTHDTLALMEIRRLHDEQLTPEIERLSGVLAVEDCGIGEPEVRVQLDLGRLRAYGLTARQVRDAMGGFLGSRGSDDSDSAGLRNLTVGAGAAGAVRLSDVAAVRIGTTPHACACEATGKPALCVTVRGRDAGSGAGAVASAVREKLRQWAASTNPGMQLQVSEGTAHSTMLEVWVTSEIREEAEAATAGAVGAAVRSGAKDRPYRVQVGARAERFGDGFGPDGYVEVRAADDAMSDEMETSLAAAIEKAAPWVRVAPPAASASAEAVVQGPELAQLARIARDIREKVVAGPDVARSLVLGAGQRAGLDVRVNRERAAMLGVRTDDAAWATSLLFGGEVLHASLLPSVSKLAVRLELGSVGNDLGAASLLSVPTASGGSVPLAEVAEIRMKSRPDPILREDGRRAVLVRVWARRIASRGWRDGVVQAATQVTLPAGYTVTWRDVKP